MTSSSLRRSSRSFRDLEIYHLAHNLAVELHQFSLRFPKYEMYETGSQLRRSSKSISANIVEGYGRRRYKAEFVRFLVYAQASCDETSEWLTYAQDCHSNFSDEIQQPLERLDEVGRKLNRFLQSVEAGHKSAK